MGWIKESVFDWESFIKILNLIEARNSDSKGDMVE